MKENEENEDDNVRDETERLYAILQENHTPENMRKWLDSMWKIVHGLQDGSIFLFDEKTKSN